MNEATSIIGTSGHIAVHLISTSTGDPAFVVEQTQLGELVDLPDLATAREVHDLLGRAIMLAEMKLIVDTRLQALLASRRSVAGS